MKQAIQKAWSERKGLACLLWPVSLVYRLLTSIRRYLYQAGVLESSKLGVPVIVVGNVVAGGGGKTPLVIALVQHLQIDGWQVGVVSRGYGRRNEACQEVHVHTPVEEAGDEPLLIKRRTAAPLFVGTKRVTAARALLTAHPATQIIVSDDGLQHYALQRDIEIVVFDDRGIGNGWLLPAGPLREPWPASSHARPCLILHTGHKPAFGGFTSSRQLSANAIARDGSPVAMHTLRGQPVVAVAAIANPGAFFDMLRLTGQPLAGTVSLPDHHNIVSSDLQGLVGNTILCTEKDAVKIFALPSSPSMNVLAVPLEFQPEPSFFKALDALLLPLLSQLPSSHGTQTA